MTTFKLIIDLLSSGAALVAIIAALVAWYRSARKPIAIDRLVIHKKEHDSTFILVLKNRKNFPITIRRIDCHKQRHFTVQKKASEPPEYQELLSMSDQIVADAPGVELPANAHTDIRITAGPVADSYPKLLFTLETSHGFHQIWCGNILVVPIGVVSTYSVDYKRDFHSKLRARLFYAWAIFRNAIGWKIQR